VQDMALEDYPSHSLEISRRLGTQNFFEWIISGIYLVTSTSQRVEKTDDDKTRRSAMVDSLHWEKKDICFWQKFKTSQGV